MIERTDGIPLFIEEMTKAMLEADGEEEALRTAAAISLLDWRFRRLCTHR